MMDLFTAKRGFFWVILVKKVPPPYFWHGKEKIVDSNKFLLFQWFKTWNRNKQRFKRLAFPPRNFNLDATNCLRVYNGAIKN